MDKQELIANQLEENLKERDLLLLCRHILDLAYPNKNAPNGVVTTLVTFITSVSAKYVYCTLSNHMDISNIGYQGRPLVNKCVTGASDDTAQEQSEVVYLEESPHFKEMIKHYILSRGR